jgi:hypothetical protein
MHSFISRANHFLCASTDSTTMMSSMMSAAGHAAAAATSPAVLPASREATNFAQLTTPGSTLPSSLASSISSVESGVLTLSQSSPPTVVSLPTDSALRSKALVDAVVGTGTIAGTTGPQWQGVQPNPSEPAFPVIVPEPPASVVSERVVGIMASTLMQSLLIPSDPCFGATGFICSRWYVLYLVCS